MSQSWKRLKESSVFKAGFFDLKKGQYQLPDGRIMPEYYTMEFLDWVHVVALTPKKEIILVRQYRPPGEKSFLEFPGGGVSPSDPSPLVAAQRELEEETAYQSKKWSFLGAHYPNPALLTNRMHTFLALDCEKTGQLDWDPFEELETEIYPVSELGELLSSGQLDHSLVLASLALSWKHLGFPLP